MSSQHHRLITSGQATLAVTEAGQGTTIVFLHAGITDQRSWAAQQQTLQAHYHTVTYDRRGYGETTTVPEAYSEMGDLLTVLDAIGAEQAILVGNSKGGRLALDFTVTYPHRVSALVLVNPAVSGAPQWQLNREIAPLEAVEEQLLVRQDLDGLNQLEARIWLDGALSEEGRVQGDVRTLFLEMNKPILSAKDVGDDMDQVEAYSHLQDLQQPSLVIIGDLDFPDFQSLSGYVAHVLPEGEFRVLAGTAHLSALEQPERFNAVLQDFLIHLPK